MRAADRRTWPEDKALLEDHLRRVYALSVQTILPTDTGEVTQPRVIKVILSEEFPKNMPCDPPKSLGYAEIRYIPGYDMKL